MNFSIVICTYSKLKWLKLTLKSYELAYHLFPCFEVVICNDGGEVIDEKKDLGGFSFPINYLYIPHSGRAIARNIGIAATKYDWILFNDDDILINPQCLQYHINCHDTNDFCVVLGTHQQLYLSENEIDGYNKDDETLDFSRFQEQARPDSYVSCTKNILFKRQKKTEHWICGSSGAFSAPKSVILDVGGFDEGFHGWGYEDIEFAYRLSHKGLPSYCNLNFPNYHIDHPRNKKVLISELKKNILFFYRKHYGDPAIRYYWDFLRGDISFIEFDQKTYHELSECDDDNSRYYGLILSRLPDIENL